MYKRIEGSRAQARATNGGGGRFPTAALVRLPGRRLRLQKWYAEREGYAHRFRSAVENLPKWLAAYTGASENEMIL